MREVPCVYIVSERSNSKGDEKPANTDNADEDKDKDRTNAAIASTKHRQRRQSAADRPPPPPRTVSWRCLISPEERQAERDALAKLSVIVKEGCSLRFLANGLLAHQQRDCAERFVYCRHGCGAFLKWREQNEHDDVEHLLQTDLHLAAEEGDLERVKDHVEGRDNFRRYAVNCRDEEGNTALHYAAAAGHAYVVRYLLAQRAAPDVAGLHGRTPLLVAAADGQLAIAEQLLQAGARVDAPDAAAGWTPLHHASFRGRRDLVDLLLRSRADPSAPDARRGDTPLHVALAGGHGDVAERLADAGADLNRANARRAKVFYHTFDKASGRPVEVRRGDVPQDYARGGAAKRYVRPALDEQLAAIGAAVTLDPRYGSTFETAAAARRPSPAKERALGRSPSPQRGRPGSPAEARDGPASPQR
jgi:hypothetical protein